LGGLFPAKELSSVRRVTDTDGLSETVRSSLDVYPGVRSSAVFWQ
jgi:hypothetical protein